MSVTNHFPLVVCSCSEPRNCLSHDPLENCSVLQKKYKLFYTLFHKSKGLQDELTVKIMG